MKNRYIIRCLLLFLVAGTLYACSGSKAMTKKAAKLEAAGDYTSAAQFYYNALQRKSTNVEARIGLKNAGQKVLNDHLDEVFKAHALEKHKETVYAYQKADAYKSKIGRMNVKLEVPEHYTTDYEDSREIYLNSLYEEGSSLMENEEYDKAEKVFAEIGRLNPEFKDADELKNVAYMEPLYKKGMASIEQEDYRSAYNYFDKVVKRSKTYKDALEFKEEALKAGRYTIALFPFENASGIKNIEEKFSAYALNSLSGIKDPFVKIVDRENMDRIIEEQELSLSGIFEESSAAQVGDLIGAKAAVVGKVISYKETKNSVKKQSKSGFESYREKRYNKEEDKTYYVTKYKSVRYYQYTGSNKVTISIQYKLVSLETGEVLLSQIVEKEAKDGVNYATYDGNKKNLFKNLNGKADTSKGGKRSINGLLSGKREMKSTVDLANDLYKTVSKNLSADVTKYVVNNH